MSNKRILLLCSECFSTNAVYNRVNQSWPVEYIVTEEPMRGMALARRRIKKLGFFRVAAQVLFSATVVPVLRLISKKRIREINAAYNLEGSTFPQEKRKHFSTVNDTACIEYIKNLNPDIVIVNGTRIISKKMLTAVPAIFINMHTGITPKYRGVHGGYWALANSDKENFGVTVHLVDKGIDTGGVLYQQTVAVTGKDNFVTYPYLQFGAGVELLEKAVADCVENKVKVVESKTTTSGLYYHPGIFKYLYLRIFKGIK